MPGGDQRSSRADHHSPTEPDPGVVEEGATLVDEHLLHEIETQPVIRAERGMDRDALRHGSSEDLFEQCGPARMVAEGQYVRARREISDRRTLSALARNSGVRTRKRRPLGMLTILAGAV